MLINPFVSGTHCIYNEGIEVSLEAKPMQKENDRGASARRAGGEASGNPGDKLGLEEIVHLSNKIGLEYAAAKKEADKLELLKPTVRAKISMRLDDGKMTESKIKRLTETDDEYLAFLEKLAEARGECDQLRVRYESYKNLFEARRSLLSYQKAEMNIL